MGTYQSTDIDVTVPADRVAGLAQAIRDGITDNPYSGTYGSDWTDLQLVGAWLPQSEGNESRLEDEETFTVEEDGSVVIRGSFYGKLSFDLEDVEALYARHGAVGIIDSMCEEAPMRVRFKDGAVSRHGGVIVYPGDEEGGEQ